MRWFRSKMALTMGCRSMAGAPVPGCGPGCGPEKSTGMGSPCSTGMNGASSAAESSMRWRVGVTFRETWAVRAWVKPMSWRTLPGQR